MSVDYQVIVPNGKWPTFEQINQALKGQNFPVVVLPGSNSTYSDLVCSTPGTLGMQVELDGSLVELEGGPFTHTSRSISEYETNDVLEELGADTRIEVGDVEFGVSLRSNPAEWVAACYVMAVLVREFDGYGYETQSNTHGQTEWADDLVASARQGFAS